MRTVGTLLLLCWLARFAPAQETACQSIEGDRILAKDLAAALPAFSRIPSEMILANSPQPGFKRILHSNELKSLARRYGIEYDTTAGVCFGWAMQPLDRARIIEAMQASLQAPGARIEIVETSMYQVPRGRMEFPRERLGTPATPEQREPVLWRGDVVYGGQHRFAVWARVRVKISCQRVIANEDLKPGRPIAAGQIRVEDGVCFPEPPSAATGKDRIAGMLPLRTIPAGAEVRVNWLARPYDVARGELVDVEVLSGTARLRFSAPAESDGRLGDSVAIRNPLSNRVFQARVRGRSKVLLLLDFTERN
jgi:flagella basal body P-ring formation protein FlgA